MATTYTMEEVQAFIEDYEDEYGVVVPYGDALCILSLFDSLCALLEEYEGDDLGGCLPLRMMPSYHR